MCWVYVGANVNRAWKRVAMMYTIALGCSLTWGMRGTRRGIVLFRKVESLLKCTIGFILWWANWWHGLVSERFVIVSICYSSTFRYLVYTLTPVGDAASSSDLGHGWSPSRTNRCECCGSRVHRSQRCVHTESEKYGDECEGSALNLAAWQTIFAAFTSMK